MIGPAGGRAAEDTGAADSAGAVRSRHDGTVSLNEVAGDATTDRR
jgi:hypothetical protein